MTDFKSVVYYPHPWDREVNRKLAQRPIPARLHVRCTCYMKYMSTHTGGYDKAFAAAMDRNNN